MRRVRCKKDENENEKFLFYDKNEMIETLNSK